MADDSMSSLARRVVETLDTNTAVLCDFKAEVAVSNGDALFALVVDKSFVSGALCFTHGGIDELEGSGSLSASMSETFLSSGELTSKSLCGGVQSIVDG